MLKLFKYLKLSSEQRLRERCVKYAVDSDSLTVLLDATYLYNYIKHGTTEIIEEEEENKPYLATG